MLILLSVDHWLFHNRRLLWLSTYTFFVISTVLILKLLRYDDKIANVPQEYDYTPSENENRQITRSRSAARNKCLPPNLLLWHPELKSLFNDPQPLQCNETPNNWITVKDGKFLISEAIVQKYGEPLCQYVPIIRGNDDFQVSKGRPIMPMKAGFSINSDVFEAKCVAQRGAVHSNIYLGISNNTVTRNRCLRMTKNLPKNSLRLNIVMFGFDSVSRMTWMRNLPKSHLYFVNELNGVVLEGYNIVGDGTTKALLPILTGKIDTELPESRRGFPNATNVDNHPWIWKELRDMGYVTQWGEDISKVGTFTYRMLGFKKQPVDHYMRTFYLVAEKQYARYKKYCFGSLPRHLNMMNWLRDFMDMYRHQLKFSFVFHSEYSHETHGNLRLADNDLLELLKHLNDSGQLNNTLLILMSDHGARFQDVRQTEQGKYEERLPYFAVRLPAWFTKTYPEHTENLRRNSKRLTTPFDIYATFRDIISFEKNYIRPAGGRAISLLRSIPEDRSCKEAGIAIHWCTCLQWTTVPVSDETVISAATSLINAINQLTTEVRNMCPDLLLHNISSAKRYVSTMKVMKFRKSLVPDEPVPDLSEDIASELIHYQLIIETYPGYGLFEATVKFIPVDNTFAVNENDISRINEYGSQPQCIAHQLPHLRFYCYCIH